jgi:type I restriction enzyme S subunit
LPELPEGWVWARLGSVAEVQLGQQRAPIHAAAKVTHPYVRAANITWRGLDLTDVKEMGFPDLARYRLEPGDVLLSEASGSASEVGKPAIWRGEIPGCCYQKTLLRVRSFSADLLPEWLHLNFLCAATLGRFAKLAPGVGILHLTAERMLEWPMPLPSRGEQRRVLAEVERLLSVADEVDASLQAQLTRAQRLRQAVLKRAFEGQLLGSHRTVSPVPTTAAPAVTVDTPPPSRELPANAVGARLAAFASWKDEADAQLARRWGISLAHVDVLRRSEVIVEPGLLSHASRALAPVLSGLTAAQIRAVLNDLALMDDAASDGPTLMAARSRA